jgi:endonuclease YncB( thermonuclease family)
MSDAFRFEARRRVSRFVPPPPRRRTRLPVPVLVIGFVLLLVASGGKMFAPARTTGPIALTAVRVIDGGTLDAGGERIRLVGIDDPEMQQTCRDAQGRNWACGVAARDELAALVAHGSVICSRRGRDRTGATLAACSAGDIADLGAALVRAGYAVSAMNGDHRYLAEENAARDDGIGLWRGAFERPADWRRRHRPQG